MTGAEDEPTPAADKPARRPTPSAQAASRARRIGGRPLPSARPSAEISADDEATAPVASKTEAAPSLTPRPGGMRAARAAAAQRLSKTASPPERPERPEKGDAHPQSGAIGRLRRWRPRIDRQRLRWLPSILAGAVAAVLLAITVWQSHGVWWAKSSTQSTRTATRTEVLAAAKTCGAVVVSYDYRNLAASKSAGVACVTGAFKTKYIQAMDTTITKLAPQTKTVQTFQIAKAGVQSVSGDGKQWVVLIYGQQSVTNSSTPANQPRQDVLSIQATLDKVGAKWLISAVQEVS